MTNKKEHDKVKQRTKMNGLSIILPLPMLCKYLLLYPHDLAHPDQHCPP